MDMSIIRLHRSLVHPLYEELVEEPYIFGGNKRPIERSSPLLAALGVRIRDPLRFSKQFLYEVGRIGDRVAQETLHGLDAQHRKENAPSLGERNNPPRYPALQCISF